MLVLQGLEEERGSHETQACCSMGVGGRGFSRPLAPHAASSSTNVTAATCGHHGATHHPSLTQRCPLVCKRGLSSRRVEDAEGTAGLLSDT